MKNGVYLLLFIVSSVNLFQDRLLYSVFEKKQTKEEEDFTKSILNSLDVTIKNPKNIELLSVNDNYDLYRFELKNESFCLKVSFDPECEYLQTEENNLKKINKFISPILLKSGKVKVGDYLYCLITSFENADSIYSIGSPVVYEKFDNFCEAYCLLQDSKSLVFNYKKHITKFLNNNNLNSMDQEQLDSIEEYTDLNKLKNIFENLHKDLKTIKHESLNERKFLCHGNLNKKNILYRNGYFKFINFGDSYNSHCFLDLADLIINLNFDEKNEVEAVHFFCDSLNLNFKDNREIYSICYDIAIRKNLLNTIYSYLKEVYLLKSMRSEKIIDISKHFSNNYQRFLKINHFFENKDFLFKTITEPILHQRA